MEQVSKTWDELHTKTMLPRQHLEVSMNICEKNATEGNTLDVQDVWYTAKGDIDKVVKLGYESIGNLSYLEQNHFILDGSITLADETTDIYHGYASNSMSDNFGKYTTPVVATINTSEPVTANGITIRWYPNGDEYPVEFTVDVYSPDGKKTYIYTKNTSSVTEIIDSMVISSVVITINKWCLPNRRARIEHVLMGLQRVYRDSELLSYTHSSENSPINSIIPQSTITFDVDNSQGDIDMLAETGIAQYIKANQPITVRYGQEHESGNTEWIKGGTYYLTSYSVNPDNHRASFEARDIFGQLESKYDSTWTANKEVSFLKYATDILRYASLSDGYEVNADNGKYYDTTNAPLPDENLGVLLQYLTQAVRCNISADRDGKIVVSDFNALKDKVKDYTLTKYEQYSSPVVSTNSSVDNLIVKEYNYITESSKTQLYNKVVDLRDGVNVPYRLKINTTESYKSYNVTAKDKLRSVSLPIEVYGDYIIVSLNEARRYQVTVEAEKLKSNISYTDTETANSVTVDNPIITNRSTANAVKNMTNYYLSNKKEVKVSDFRANVKLEPLDIIYIECGDKVYPMVITSIVYDYSGAFHGSIEGRILSEDYFEIVDESAEYVPVEDIGEDASEDSSDDSGDTGGDSGDSGNTGGDDTPTEPEPETPQYVINKITAEYEKLYLDEDCYDLSKGYGKNKFTVYPADVTQIQEIADQFDTSWVTSGNPSLTLQVDKDVEVYSDYFEVRIQAGIWHDTKDYDVTVPVTLNVFGLTKTVLYEIHYSHDTSPTYYKATGVVFDESNDFSNFTAGSDSKELTYSMSFDTSDTQSSGYYESGTWTLYAISVGKSTIIGIDTDSKSDTSVKLIPKAEGSTFVKVTLKQEGTNVTKTNTYEITVLASATPYYISGLSLVPDPTSMYIRSSTDKDRCVITPIVSYSGNSGDKPEYTITATSSSNSVATVSTLYNGNVVVTPVKAGSVTITVTATETESGKKKSSSITLRIYDVSQPTTVSGYSSQYDSAESTISIDTGVAGYSYIKSISITNSNDYDTDGYLYVTSANGAGDSSTLSDFTTVSMAGWVDNSPITVSRTDGLTASYNSSTGEVTLSTSMVQSGGTWYNVRLYGRYKYNITLG